MILRVPQIDFVAAMAMPYGYTPLAELEGYFECAESILNACMPRFRVFVHVYGLHPQKPNKI